MGIIGCGTISERHIEGFRDAGADIVGAVARSQESRARIKNDLSVPVFETTNQLFSECSPDGVVVASPNHIHAAHTIAAIEAGCHVLCEKPMAMTGREARTMLQKSLDAEKCLMVALNLRFAGHTRIAAELSKGGSLGHIYHARCGWIRRRSIPGIGRWFTTKQLSGGGAMIDAGIHVLDVAWFLMGKPRPVSVSAGTRSLFGGRIDKYSSDKVWGRSDLSGTMDVEDFCTAFVRFENGSTLQLDVAWAANTQETGFYCNIFGERGGIAWDKRGRLESYDADGRGAVVCGKSFASPANKNAKSRIKGAIKKLIGTKQHAGKEVRIRSAEEFPTMYGHFIQCMDGADCLVPGEDGYILQSIIDAIYKSADELREVRVEA